MFVDLTDSDYLPSLSTSGMPRLTRDRRLDQRAIPEECAIAPLYDGTTAAVVMATPADLTDLAIGFSLTDGIIAAASEIEGLGQRCIHNKTETVSVPWTFS